MIVCKRGVIIPWVLWCKSLTDIQELLTRDFIHKSESQWRNPIRIIKNEDGAVKLVRNLIMLSDLTIKDNYALPEIKRIIESVVGAKFKTILDFKEGYYYIEIFKIMSIRQPLKSVTKSINGIVMCVKND